jgi:hypothetical protein
MIAARARALRLACGLTIAAALLTSPALAGPYDPALRFKTHRTPHFVIHFHQGEEALALRLAGIAEHVRGRLIAAMGAGGPMSHVVLVDQADFSNGFAAVVPWNAIVIYAAPPSGAETIGNTDDWLEYVFTHEYVHVVHLDRSRGWARWARGLFGRSPVAFPNLSLPLWQIEGLATFLESGAEHGRLHAGDFRTVVDVAAAHGRLEPIDRVSGGLVDWPSGQGWYAYGARFHEYLARTYGPDTLNALADRTAGRFPYLTSGAFRAVFGKSLGELWHDFRREVEGAPAESSSELRGRRITRLGYLVGMPRQGLDGSIYFSATDAHRFPAVFRLTAEGEVVEVATRYGGTGLSVGRAGVVFDQLEFVRGVALVSDLYHTSRPGQSRRLTGEARLGDPELSPDGRRLAAIRYTPGGRVLVLLDAERLLAMRGPLAGSDVPVVASLPEAPGLVMASPRWSPDGSLVAVERRVLDGPSTIALLDATSLRDVAVVTAPAGGRVAEPAWTPDGATLLFAAADAEQPFEIRAVDLGPGGRLTTPRRVLAPRGGARAPLATRDGRLVYVGYTTDGHDLFELAAGEWPRDGGDLLSHQAAAPPGPAGAHASASLDATPYRPWPTLVPRAWEPIVESRDNRLRLGAAVYGTDVLQRHVASALATWAVTADDDHRDLAPTGRPDWNASYTYQRWQPALYAIASDRTSLFDVVDPAGNRQPVAQRERTFDVGLWRAFRRVRWAHTVLAAYHIEQFETTTRTVSDLRRGGLRTAWTFSSAKRYGHSISAESGITAAATAEVFRAALGSDGSAEAFTGDLRAYLPLWPRHGVLAARLAGAHSAGDRAIRRRFQLGGTDGNPAAGVFGNDAISLLRGFQDDVFVGDNVAVLNLEARVPLASVQRGWGTWPFFLRTLHGAGFADIGHAWSASPTWGDRKLGYGVEVSADVVLGYAVPLTLTGGLAWGDDGAGLVPRTRELYFRVGRSF